MTSRETLIEQLMGQPVLIAEIERELYEAEQRRLAGQRVLENAEDRVLLSYSPPNGKNAETRAAQLREATMTERLGLADAESAVQLLRSRLRVLMVEFSALKATARLMAGGDE